MGGFLKIERPCQRVYIDLLGLYPRSGKGNTVSFDVVNQMTKFFLLKALPKATTPKILSFLTEDVLPVFGVQEFVYSDNGSQFVENMFKSLEDDYSIQHNFTSI